MIKLGFYFIIYVGKEGVTQYPQKKERSKTARVFLWVSLVTPLTDVYNVPSVFRKGLHIRQPICENYNVWWIKHFYATLIF